MEAAPGFLHGSYFSAERTKGHVVKTLLCSFFNSTNTDDINRDIEVQDRPLVCTLRMSEYFCAFSFFVFKNCISNQNQVIQLNGFSLPPTGERVGGCGSVGI